MPRQGLTFLSLTLVLAITTPAPAQTVPPEAAEVLLRSAWLWQTKERQDLARLALEKLQNVTPNHPQGLMELGLLDLNSGRADNAAILLQRLRETNPNHPATKRLAEALRMATKDRFQMLAVRRLDESGDSDAAVDGLRKLFPDGPPDGELGIDYYKILASAPGQRANAIAGMRRLMQDNPGNPRYPLALAGLLLKQPDTSAEGFRLFAKTSREYDLHQPSVLTAWREGLRNLPQSPQFETLYQEYLAAVPNDPEVSGMLSYVKDPAIVSLERGLQQINSNQLKSAEESMGLAYSQKPDGTRVLQGLALLRARQGRTEEAGRLFEQARLGDPDSSSHARGLAARADGDLAAGRLNSARSLLETAVQMDPEDPWARLDLARLYARLGLASKGREVMAQGVKGEPPNPEALYAQAIFLSGLNDRQGVLRAIYRVPRKDRTPEMGALAERTRADIQRREILAAAAAGNSGELERLMARAEKSAGSNVNRLGNLAELWLDLGYTDRGVALLGDRLRASSEPSAALQLAYAGVLDRVRRDEELQPLVSTLNDRAGRRELNSAQRKDLATIDKRLTLRRAEHLASQGRYDEGVRLLQEAEDRYPKDSGLLLARADLLTDIGKYSEARDIYDSLLKKSPDDIDTRLSYARFLRKSGQTGAARAEYDAILAKAPRSDVDTRLAVVRGYLALDEPDAARKVTDGLRNTAPEDPAVLVHSGRVEAADSNYPEAIAYYRQAQDTERRKNGGLAVSTPGNLSAADDELLRLERRRRDGYLTVGLDYSTKPGDPGVSQLTDIEIPVELHLPIGYETRLLVLADPVRLDAGTLPADYDIAGLYGQVQASGSVPASLVPDGSRQEYQGLMAGVGIETQNWRLDVGTTPTTFPVHYLVGGIQYDFSAGLLGGAVEVSRRPITASLVSFSGAEDPVSGEIWGGVRRTGASLRLAYGDRDLNHFGSVGAYKIDGENVPSNTHVPLRLGSEWRLLNRGDDEFFVGWTGNYWYYDKNQRHYTFGHGGYYSPQTYLSGAITLDWMGRWDRLAYRLRGTGSAGRTSEASALFYPTRPDLQTAAAGQPLPAGQGFTAPVYDGGSGGGRGYSLFGALEYELHPNLFIGTSGALDRSEFYKPVFYSLYLRYPFNGWEGPVNFPPRPPTPYSRY